MSLGGPVVAGNQVRARLILVLVHDQSRWEVPTRQPLNGFQGNRTVAKRPRHSRWRRLPGVYRFGESKGPDPSLEPQRLTLYLTGAQLDTAEALATRAGVATIQEYCTRLLQKAIEDERVRAQVAGLEAQRGPFEGLQQIADDPEYLAEWSVQAQAQARDRPDLIRREPPADRLPVPESSSDIDQTSFSGSSPEPETEPMPVPAPPEPDERGAPLEKLSPSAEVVLRHAAQAGDDPSSFLPSLRRGEPVPLTEVAELARALHLLEAESRDASVLDRRVVYALHRLAFESQVLHTDAWPGAFDEWTVDTLRAVQEAVDRILSGQDIRYDSPGARLEIPL
jgi:hypothetical protein